MLVDAGKLRWNDPATKYLPSLQLPDPWVTRELTVRDLVTHRVGLDRGDALWELTDLSRDEVLRRQRFLGRVASFRSAFGYNNNMFLAAGESPADDPRLALRALWHGVVPAGLSRP